MVSKLLYSLGNEIVKAMRSDIDNNTGELSKSIKFDTKRTPIGYNLSIEINEYGQYVDTGTRGTSTGNPNRKMPITKNGNNWKVIDGLNRWAETKGLNAWAVAFNIQKFGTKAHPFIHNFEDVINRNIDNISKAVGFEIEDRIYKALIKE